ncbi:hypothetical protein CLU79DRAFT_754171 [Phycomyces nitens]|nr:hypothetical protein CLU79DRAFT_754171 [Phycomyces nitens]
MLYSVVAFALTCLVLSEAAPSHHTTIASSASAASTLVPDANSHTDTLVPWSTIDSIIIEEVPIVPMQEMDPAMLVPNHAVDRFMHRHQQIKNIQKGPISETSYKVPNYITNPEVMVPVPEYLIEDQVEIATVRRVNPQDNHSSIKTMVAGLFDDILSEEEDAFSKEFEKENDHTRIFVGMDDKGNTNTVKVPLSDFFKEDQQDTSRKNSYINVDNDSSVKISQSSSGKGHQMERTVYVSSRGRPEDTVVSMNDRGQVIRMSVPHSDTTRDILSSDMPFINVFDNINGNDFLF